MVDELTARLGEPTTRSVGYDCASRRQSSHCRAQIIDICLLSLSNSKQTAGDFACCCKLFANINTKEWEEGEEEEEIERKKKKKRPNSGNTLANYAPRNAFSRPSC